MSQFCRSCPYCDVITDEEYQKNLKCTKTSKRGKTLAWSMCVVGENVYSYFAEYLDKHDRPSWCPLAKGESKKSKPSANANADFVSDDDTDEEEPIYSFPTDEFEEEEI